MRSFVFVFLASLLAVACAISCSNDSEGDLKKKKFPRLKP